MCLFHKVNRLYWVNTLAQCTYGMDSQLYSEKQLKIGWSKKLTIIKKGKICIYERDRISEKSQYKEFYTSMTFS